VRSEATIRIWKMIAACCCCFLPSDQFKKTLFAFLLQHANDKQAGGMKADTTKPKKRSVSALFHFDFDFDFDLAQFFCGTDFLGRLLVAGSILR
jgi:hypothetical protein